MRYAIAGAAVAVIAAAALVVAFSAPSHAASPAACKAAMAKDYLTTLRNPVAPPAAEPAACHGVPTATVSQYAAQIMAGH